MKCPICQSSNIHRTTPEKCVCRDCLNVFDNLQVKEEAIPNKENLKKSKFTILTLDDLLVQLKKFNLLTTLGVIFEITFVILCFQQSVFNWLIMLPIALLSFGSFYKVKNDIKGFEKQVCTYGIWSLIGILIIRDIYISHKIKEIIDAFSLFNDSLGDWYDYQDPIDKLFE